MKYKIVRVDFPFLNNGSRSVKARPALCLTKPSGKHQLILVAYITSKTEEIEDTDILLQDDHSDFLQTGLRFSSLIKLHKVTSISLENIAGQIGILSEQWSKEVQQNLRTLLMLG